MLLSAKALADIVANKYQGREGEAWRRWSFLASHLQVDGRLHDFADALRIMELAKKLLILRR